MAKARAREEGVRVTIQLHSGKPGVEMIISLPVACAWNGRMLNRTQHFITDSSGKVVVTLPPTEEIKSLAKRSPATISYKLECAPIGVLTFQVPNVPEWTLGTPGNEAE
jgi:hypothetical protein